MQPEARVKAFIADYHQTHSQFIAEKDDDGDEFERWQARVSALDEAHFVDGGGMELANSYGGSSAHTLELESIMNVTRSGDRVFVETLVAEVVEHYYEYELREVQPGNWKIVRAWYFLDAADTPFLQYENDKSKFDNPRVRPLQPLSAEEAPRDRDKLFIHGGSIEYQRKNSSIEVRSVGMLNATTGILVVGDLAYGPEVLSAVGQRVPPGNYAAEVAVAVAFRRNLALRVRFSDEKVVAWHPADMGKRGHVVGVDAGNVAVMDLAAIMTVKARDKERALDAYTRDDERPRMRMMSLVGTNDTVIADSGWGDGSYPVYWGADAAGKPAVLLVDFMLCP